MKKIIHLIAILSMLSCQSQNIQPMEPTIDNQFEKLDFNLLNEINKKRYIQKIDIDENYTELILLTKTITFRLTYKNSYFKIIKVYNNNGDIKLKGIGFNGNAFQKGIWYEFDEQGNLIKEIDYDKPYKFTFEDLLKFCEKEKIQVDKGPILLEKRLVL